MGFRRVTKLDQQILLINQALPLDSRGGLVRALRSCIYGFVHEYWRVVDVRIQK